MKTNAKKILINEELKLASVGEFFQGLGFELISEYNSDDTYEFVFGDYEVEDSTIKRVVFEDECFFESSANYLLKADSKLFNHPAATELLSSFFSNSYDFLKLEDIKNSTIINLKLQDYLNLGFFIDSIVINGHKNNFNVLKIRKFLNEMSEILFQKINTEFISRPIEINYAFDEDSLKIHFEFTCDQVDVFQEELIEKDILHMSNFSELVIFQRRNRVVFKNIFFKDSKLNNLHAYSVKEFDPEKGASIPAFDYSAVSGLEDPGYVAFDEFADNDMLTKISLGEEELTEIVQYFSADNSVEDFLTLVGGDKDLESRLGINVIKHLEENIKTIISSGQRMTLGELKDSINRAFSDDNSEEAKKLFLKIIDQLKKNQQTIKQSSEKNSESYRLKVSLQKSMDIIKTKDALIKKIKRDAEIKSEHQRQELKQLDQKLKAIRGEMNLAKNRPEVDQRSKNESIDESMLQRSSSANSEQEQIGLIEDLRNEIKSSEEELKRTQLEVKKLEQKLKFSNSQFDSLMKKKNVVPKGVAKANFDLLRDNEGLKANLRKLEQELAEKKTEGHRFKQESAILLSKISDLEKKLAYAEKKAA